MTDADAPVSNQVWTSRSGFILATIGSAIGVGSIWKFPYEVGANGGGAFVLVYVLGIALMVMPLVLAEFAIGHRGQADAATKPDNTPQALTMRPTRRDGVSSTTERRILAVGSLRW